MDCITTGKPGLILGGALGVQGSIKGPGLFPVPLMSSLSRGKRGAGDLIPWTVSQQVSYIRPNCSDCKGCKAGVLEYFFLVGYTGPTTAQS